jgi:hypothetical protein
MYKPDTTNYTDILIKREQDTDNQTATKTVLQTQILLKPKQLDLWILTEIAVDTELYSIETSVDKLDLIDKLLQTNQTVSTL